MESSRLERAAAIEKMISLLPDNARSRRVIREVANLFDRHYDIQQILTCTSNDAYLTAFMALLIAAEDLGEFTAS